MAYYDSCLPDTKSIYWTVTVFLNNGRLTFPGIRYKLEDFFTKLEDCFAVWCEEVGSQTSRLCKIVLVLSKPMKAQEIDEWFPYGHIRPENRSSLTNYVTRSEDVVHDPCSYGEWEEWLDNPSLIPEEAIAADDDSNDSPDLLGDSQEINQLTEVPNGNGSGKSNIFDSCDPEDEKATWFITGPINGVPWDASELENQIRSFCDYYSRSFLWCCENLTDASSMKSSYQMAVRTAGPMKAKVISRWFPNTTIKSVGRKALRDYIFASQKNGVKILGEYGDETNSLLPGDNPQLVDETLQTTYEACDPEDSNRNWIVMIYLKENTDQVFSQIDCAIRRFCELHPRASVWFKMENTNNPEAQFVCRIAINSMGAVKAREP